MIGSRLLKLLPQMYYSKEFLSKHAQIEYCKMRKTSFIVLRCRRQLVRNSQHIIQNLLTFQISWDCKLDPRCSMLWIHFLSYCTSDLSVSNSTKDIINQWWECWAYGDWEPLQTCWRSMIHNSVRFDGQSPLQAIFVPVEKFDVSGRLLTNI